MTQCIACRRRESDSIEEDGIPPLCHRCWDRRGRKVRTGERVVCTASHPNCSGVVRENDPDDHIVVVQTDEHGLQYIPRVELVVVE